jgi:drug/metabolite transporter (DMT)-like permease
MLLLAALWGASYAFIKVALEDVSPTFLVAVRIALGAAVLAPIAAARGAFAPARRHLGPLALVAAVQTGGPFLLIAVGETRIPSALAGILVASAPIFTTLLAAAFVPAERLTRLGVGGIALGMVGIVLLFGVDLGDSTDALVGGLLVLLAGLGYAVGALVVRAHLREVPPLGVAAGVMALATLAMVPTVPFALPAQAPGLDTVASLLVLGAGGTGVAFLIFYTLNAEVGPSRASVVAYVAPVFSVLYGVALLDEPFGLGAGLGLVLILAGSWLAADGRLPRRRSRVAAGAAGRDGAWTAASSPSRPTRSSSR